jgi:U2-associated protein SR140
VVECIVQSLSVLETPVPLKVARLFLVSDILHNSTASVKKAAFLRTQFESTMPTIFAHLNKTFKAITGRLRAEQFRVRHRREEGGGGFWFESGCERREGCFLERRGV